jgi:hypothetical protein
LPGQCAGRGRDYGRRGQRCCDRLLGHGMFFVKGQR